MTTKELARFLGKSHQTVRRMASKAGIKAQTGKTKHYTKEEALAIIRLVYGRLQPWQKEAVDRTFNAQTAQPFTKTADDSPSLETQGGEPLALATSEPANNGASDNQNNGQKDLLAGIESIIREAVYYLEGSIIKGISDQVTRTIHNQPKQIEYKQKCYTARGYATLKGMEITMQKAATLGRAATKLSKERGKEIKKIEDERFGYINSYCVEILEEVFRGE